MHAILFIRMHTGFGKETLRKSPFGRPRCRYEDDMKCIRHMIVWSVMDSSG
jgi:hypothetical protein